MLSRWSLLILGVVALAGTALACDGLSPGDQITVDGSLCTLGFLHADRSGLYFSTAGHCVDVDSSVSSPDFESWGVGAFHFLEPENGQLNDGSPGMDFGLIRVKPEFYDQLNPKVCGWDGPVGIYEGAGENGMVRHYGHGIVLGDLPQTRAREGYFLRTTDDAFYWTGLGVNGDSGSAVLSEANLAIGVFTHGQYGVTTEDNGGTRLQRGYRLAAEAGFTELRLILAGEDPVQVLAQLRGAPPAPATPTPGAPAPAPSPGGTTPPSNSTAPSANGSASERGSPGAQNDSSIDPASDDDAAAATKDDAKTVPFPFAIVVLSAAIVVVLRKRKV